MNRLIRKALDLLRLWSRPRRVCRWCSSAPARLVDIGNGRLELCGECERYIKASRRHD